MAYFATRRFTYWSQLGILALFCGIGLLVGGFLSFLPLIGKVHMSDLKASQQQLMDTLLKPQNAEVLRWMQFISTLFLFFLPPFFYALLCHKKPWVHLGFKHRFKISQVVVVILIMLAALAIVGSLQQLTEMLPWSKNMLLRFKNAEIDYNRQVAVIARMDSPLDYIISVLVIALLPAVFEETLFRGGLQNLLSRWFKMPILGIVITAIIFSAIHGSYLGFLSRFALGFILGWIYYRTGNIWLNIIAHFFNNAFAVTALYFSSRAGEKLDPSKLDDHFPLWLGLLGVAAVYGLFRLFENVSAKDIDRPGEEVPVPGISNSDNPFANDTTNADQHTNFN